MTRGQEMGGEGGIKEHEVSGRQGEKVLRRVKAVTNNVVSISQQLRECQNVSQGRKSMALLIS